MKTNEKFPPNYTNSNGILSPTMTVRDFFWVTQTGKWKPETGRQNQKSETENNQIMPSRTTMHLANIVQTIK